MSQAMRPILSIKSVVILTLCVCGLLVGRTLMNHKEGSSGIVHVEQQQQLPPVRHTGPATEKKAETRVCSPKTKLVFLKTHKTGSTTLASVIERYGYYRNLTFAVGLSHVLSFERRFDRRDVFRFPGMAEQHFDILTNHARYHRAEMEAVVPNATYITILRRPEDQLESSFGYFEMYRGMGLTKASNPLETFMDDPVKYFKKHIYMWQLSRNGLLFDLGFDHEFDENSGKIAQKITEIDKEFDLVLLTEYFDESLILMRKLLCWEFDDILYLSKGARSPTHRFELTDSLRVKIRKWSYGDVSLYEHFNKTFWNKVAQYGPDFKKDLDYFVKLRQDMFDNCIDAGKVNKGDKRVFKLTLKNSSKKCERLLRSDTTYTSKIRMSMIHRYGVPYCFYLYAAAILLGVVICLYTVVKCFRLCNKPSHYSDPRDLSQF